MNKKRGETEEIEQEEQGNYLSDNLVPEDLLLVEDLDGDILAGLDVPCELDLAEGAFPERPAQLVPPHPRPPHSRAHPLLLRFKSPRPCQKQGRPDLNLPATCPSPRGLRSLRIAGPPLHKQLLVLLALLPLPHQDSLRPVSAGPAWNGMERQRRRLSD
jgi:hypothetical protein